jgi:hypothetical protein
VFSVFEVTNAKIKLSKIKNGKAENLHGIQLALNLMTYYGFLNFAECVIKGSATCSPHSDLMWSADT